MKPSIKAILILAGSASMMAHAAVYYVSSSGSDSNSGTSSSPWRHCPGMSGWSGSASLRAGDVVYFKSDDIWNISSGDSVLDVVGGVTYDGRTWGSGTRAKFNVQSSLGDNMGIEFNEDNATYQTAIIGIELDGNSIGLTGIGFGKTRYRSLTGTTKLIEDSHIHHCGYDGESGYSYGITTGPSGGNTHRNIEIINCVIHDIARSGLCNYVGRDDAGNKTEDVLFRGNEVYNTGVNSASAGIGISLKDHSERTIVEYNYVHDCTIGIALDAQSPHTYGPVDAVIRYNIVTGNDGGPGIYIQDINTAATKSFDIYGNIVYGNGKHGLLLESNNRGDVTAAVYNNIFYDNCQSSGSGEIYLKDDGNSSSTFDIRNNIISSQNGIPCIVDEDGSYIPTHNNNLYYRPGGGSLVTLGGTSYSASTISSWESTAQTGNPAFKNINNLPNGFMGTYGTDLVPNTDGLLPTQTAEGNGATLAAEYSGAINLAGPDYGSVRQIPWDIGAYAIASATAPTPNTEAPSTPANLAATTESSTQIDLAWSASTDDTGVSEYRIYRGGSYLASTTSTSYSDVDLTAGTTYTYKVSARDAAGNESPQSQPVTQGTLSNNDVISTSGWQNRRFASQSGQFVVEYDAISSGSTIDGVFGLSLGDATTWSELAVTTRFAPSGYIDVRNGGVYTADTQVYYNGGETYHFRIVIDIPAHQYNVYVTAPNDSEQLIAQDYTFRTGQETVDSLDTFAVNSVTGTYQVMNFTVASPAIPDVSDAGLRIIPNP